MGIEGLTTIHLNHCSTVQAQKSIERNMNMSELLKEEPIGETKQGWSCETDQDAEWCLLQIRRAQAEKERWKAHYADALKSVTAACDDTISRMEAFLMDYFKTVPHKRTKTEENYTLPSGKLMIKTQDISFDYDEDELTKWLKANGKGFVKVKETPDWAGLKDTLCVIGDTVADENGEVIPCIKAVEREPVFKVQLKK